MSSEVVIERTTSHSRSSSILGSSAVAILPIQEESNSSDNGSVHSIEIDNVGPDAVDPSQADEEENKNKPPKRLSFAPDPIQYRQARMNFVRTNQDPDNPEISNSNTFVTVVKRFASYFTSSSNLPSASDSATPNNVRSSEFTNSESNRRTRTQRTTIFTRGSTTFSVSSNDEINQENSNTHGIVAVRENPCIKQSHYNAIRWLIETKTWKYTAYIFIFIMLFGSQIQELWLPKSWDVVCDVVFTASIVFLSLDVVFQSIVDPLYFSWRCGKEKRRLLPGQRRSYSWLKPLNRCTGCNFAVGSFTFWCDVVGTLTFLNEIEYINPVLRSPMCRFVVLSPFGIPMSGLHRVGGLTGGVGNPGMNIVIAVGRAARMGRFIRTTVIVEYAAKLDVSRYFQPNYYLSEWRALRDMNRQKDTRSSLDRSSNNRPNSFGAENEIEPHRKKFFHDLARAVGISKQDSEDHVHSSHSARQMRRKAGQYSRDSSSHVGAAMRELTGQRVAIGVIVAMLLNIVFTYKEDDATPVMTMILLHGQTSNERFANQALSIARFSVVPNLFSYERNNESGLILFDEYELDSGRTVDDIRMRELLNVTISSDVADSIGMFDNRLYIKGNAMTELVTTMFILIVWIIAVTAFAGPVMTLVVQPIERMVLLLSMLMKDPLGYQNSPQYKSLMEEENLHYSPNWENEVLKGMETSFLMSTILRIGSLMQVGFGSAGTEIIRSGLERGRHKDVLFLNKQGSTVSCIFLFCDIRSFTDATECLQEEVFVFTNKIAAVVHSICHSYGGSANKNIGDAFLVSWILDDAPPDNENSLCSQGLYANSDQADKALLSVVKISIALYHDSYFVKILSDDKKTKLIAKFKDRPGPLVQMGFGLHAGKAVQGAIGSTKKLDATYISESVERAEFLESNTKKYGVPVLMSDAFYNLLDSTNQYRCRKVDQLLLSVEDDPISGIRDLQDKIESGEKMNLYTYDMDIAALWGQDSEDEVSNASSSVNELFSSTSSRRNTFTRRSVRQNRSSMLLVPPRLSEASTRLEDTTPATRELELPTGHCEYDEKCWLAPDIKKIRRKYVANGVVFPMFESGLIAFYGSQWDHAQQCFETVLSQMDDGPSKYFLKIITRHGGVPPPDFIGYGLEE